MNTTNQLNYCFLHNVLHEDKGFDINCPLCLFHRFILTAPHISNEWHFALIKYHNESRDGCERVNVWTYLFFLLKVKPREYTENVFKNIRGKRQRRKCWWQTRSNRQSCLLTYHLLWLVIKFYLYVFLMMKLFNKKQIQHSFVWFVNLVIFSYYSHLTFYL